MKGVEVQRSPHKEDREIPERFIPESLIYLIYPCKGCPHGPNITLDIQGGTPGPIPQEKLARWRKIYTEKLRQQAEKLMEQAEELREQAAATPALPNQVKFLVPWGAIGPDNEDPRRGPSVSSQLPALPADAFRFGYMAATLANHGSNISLVIQGMGVPEARKPQEGQVSVLVLNSMAAASFLMHLALSDDNRITTDSVGIVVIRDPAAYTQFRPNDGGKIVVNSPPAESLLEKLMVPGSLRELLRMYFTESGGASQVQRLPPLLNYLLSLGPDKAREKVFAWWLEEYRKKQENWISWAPNGPHSNARPGDKTSELDVLISAYKKLLEGGKRVVLQVGVRDERTGGLDGGGRVHLLALMQAAGMSPGLPPDKNIIPHTTPSNFYTLPRHKEQVLIYFTRSGHTGGFTMAENIGYWGDALKRFANCVANARSLLGT